MSHVRSLPTVLPESFNTSGKILEIRSAYSMTLLLEHAASSNPDPNIRERKLIHARVLGHLLREAPSMRARENVADQVNSCQNNDQLDALGEMYFLHYICSFRIRKNEGTESESPPSYSSLTTKKTKRELTEHILRTSGEPPQCNEEAKRRALVRDDFRCTLTGAYDIQTVRQNTGFKLEEMDSVVPTECVHILPQSIAVISGTDAKDAKHEHATSFWTIMTYLGFEDLPKKLAGNGIHSLENVMTLDLNTSYFFETLEIWFEAIDDQDNTYAVRIMPEGRLLRCEINPVTLTSQHPDLPLPNRTFLAIHAACCKIANLSGATTYLAKALEALDDMEDDGMEAWRMFESWLKVAHGHLRADSQEIDT